MAKTTLRAQYMIQENDVSLARGKSNGVRENPDDTRPYVRC